jgi:choice-of-anchor B domain-containing protein
MQVFDLTRLRNVVNPPETFTSDNHFAGFGSAHNIVINEQSGYAYAVGANTFNGGPHFINILNPTSPIDEGGYSLAQYSHDAQVITYDGPDTDYTGREIYIGCQVYIGLFTILDVTDKNNVIPISTISYPNPALPHQGWFTDDQRYFIAGDEGDEGSGKKTRTLVYDFADLDNPSLHMEYSGPTTAIDHNGYVKENTFYLANYRAGVRMIDISNLESNTMSEIGFFDTYPENDFNDFDGAWNIYPYFPSGNIIISDINRGLFVVKKSN